MGEKRFTKAIQLHLTEVAKHYDLSNAGLIRMLLKHEADQISREKAALP